MTTPAIAAPADPMSDFLPPDFDFEEHFTYRDVGRLSPPVCRVLAKNPSPFTYSGTGRYIVGTEDVQDELRPIFVGLIDALVTRVGERIQQQRRADKPLLLLLDEAANSAPVTDLPMYAATLRSRDVQLVTMFQDFPFTDGEFGKG